MSYASSGNTYTCLHVPVSLTIYVEVLRGQSYHAGPVDIFALGIILGIVLTGESPFPSPLHAQSGRIKMKRRISTDAYDLLARCVHEDPASRATVEMIEAHRWLKFPFAQRGSV